MNNPKPHWRKSVRMDMLELAMHIHRRKKGFTPVVWALLFEWARAGWHAMNELTFPRVLDACCGSRMMWFDRQHPDALYCDRRHEQHTLCDGRSLRIEPDQVLDFRALPFAGHCFGSHRQVL